jgi:peptidoglycan/LPS O-acetylase OafA/YrhL
MEKQVTFAASLDCAPAKTVRAPLRLKALDGFRGMAILSVILSHASEVVSTHLRTTGFGRAIVSLCGTGWLGVDMFFVLSGFLITGILVRTVHEPNYFLSFYIHRTLRLFPLYYGVLMIAFIDLFVTHSVWDKRYLAYLFYCQNFAQNLWPSISSIGPFKFSHFWSLAVEEQYYLLWPATIYLIRDRERLMKMCFVLAIAGLTLRCGLLLALPPAVGSTWQWYYRELPTHSEGLLIGSWIALARSGDPIQEVVHRWRHVWFGSIVVMLGIFAIGNHTHFNNYGSASIGLTASAILFGGLLALCLVPSKVSRVFTSPPLRFLGKYSYGLYVYHFILLGLMMPLLSRLLRLWHSPALGLFLFLALWVFVSITVSVLSFELFEVRWLRLKDRLAPVESSSKGSFVKPRTDHAHSLLAS